MPVGSKELERGHVQMTSVRGGGEGVAKKLTESDGEGGGGKN